VRRSRQHGAALDYRRALWEHYIANPEKGPQGYLEPLALIAADRVSQTIGLLAQSVELAGQVWQMDVLTREINVSKVVGVNGCPRCGLDRSVDSRRYLTMQRALAHFWDKPLEGG
jgi:hypothetical protein